VFSLFVEMLYESVRDMWNILAIRNACQILDEKYSGKKSLADTRVVIIEL